MMITGPTTACEYAVLEFKVVMMAVIAIKINSSFINSGIVIYQYNTNLLHCRHIHIKKKYS